MKYFELLAKTNDQPNIEIEAIKFIIEETVNKSFVYLANDEVDNLVLDRINDYLNGKSPQYIVGHCYFYGLKLNVNETVLIPRFDTESVVDKAITEIINKNNPLVLDGFCGSGAIAIAIKSNCDCLVSGFDISKDALSVARSNAKLNAVDVDFFESDVFSACTSKYDILVANPPYIAYGDKDLDPLVLKNEPSLALYAAEDGLFYYRKIMEECRSVLNEDFVIILEIPYNKTFELESLAKANNLKFEFGKDLAGNWRVMVLRESK